LTSATYKYYESSSIEAQSAGEIKLGPGGMSRLCLSCHDGTVAIGNVNVINGQSGQPAQSGQPVRMLGTTPDGKMPLTDVTTGFTRNLGTDLTNDHPISFTFDDALANSDGELRKPDGAIVGTREVGKPRPRLPLEKDHAAAPTAGGKLQCTTCHDPHLKEKNETANGPGKFLRLNRLQKDVPGAGFSETRDIFCLACHDKAGTTWTKSAHANPSVANETFKDTAADRREFPKSPPMPVWKAACLSCHDTHTVQGARRLLREGATSTGNPASEETCYQCHSLGAESILNTNAEVPNIKDDFKLATRMPINAADQKRTDEAHDIGTGSDPGGKLGKDFVESPANLGLNQGATPVTNRHVECTDCHNPHRVIRNRLFNANATVADTRGTHDHDNVAGHTNIASGVLKGTTGVEPKYPVGGTAFRTNASTFDFKRGDGGEGALTDAGQTWVTREYQVCLKCHSSYAYGESPPALGDTGGNTPLASRNGLVNYTDQAMEFQAPLTHRLQAGSTSTLVTGAHTRYLARNQRSWHPVMEATGRKLDSTGRNIGTSPWRAPWSKVGEQTMYCTDCHGSSTASGTVTPNTGKPWGPHGSENPFILKGTWTVNSGRADSSTLLCFKCHDSTAYTGGETDARTTSWYGGGKGNLHRYHYSRIDNGTFKCTWCHVAVPHGWKNRSLLVNLNDVGPEAGPQYVAGTEVTTRTFTAAPYYLNAVLKIVTFGAPGSWSDSNCGSQSGQRGKDWMRSVCENGP
jgi:predicted CXXCH cytochrome family protein